MQVVTLYGERLSLEEAEELLRKGSKLDIFDGIMEELQDFKWFDWNWILL